LLNETSIVKQLNSNRRGEALIKSKSINASVDIQLANLSRNVDFAEETGGLGKDANIVAKNQKQANYSAYRSLAYAQALLIAADVKSPRSGNIHRTRMCHAARTFVAEKISLKITTENSEINKASLSGLQTCGSVWSCPVCAKRIAVQRGLEIGYTIDEMAKLGFMPIMLTLTARHNLSDRLDTFKTKFKAAWRKFSQSGTWQRLKKLFEIEHSIKAVEVTRTYENGWHYHQHGLLFIHADELKSISENELEHWQSKVTKLWLSCLKACELDGTWERSVHIAAGENIKADYLAKLGLLDDTTNTEYELTSGQNKDYKGRNIWSILESAKDGNELDAELYIEYVKAMTGDNWITYSHGLKALVKLDEMDEIEASAEDSDGLEFEKLMDISDYQYSFVRKFRAYAELLEVAAGSRSADVVTDYLRDLERDYLRLHHRDDIKRMWKQILAIEAKLKNFELSPMKLANPKYEPIHVLNWKRQLKDLRFSVKELNHSHNRKDWIE